MYNQTELDNARIQYPTWAFHVWQGDNDAALTIVSSTDSLYTFERIGDGQIQSIGDWADEQELPLVIEAAHRILGV